MTRVSCPSNDPQAFAVHSSLLALGSPSTTDSGGEKRGALSSDRKEEDLLDSESDSWLPSSEVDAGLPRLEKISLSSDAELDWSHSALSLGLCEYPLFDLHSLKVSPYLGDV